MIYIYDTVIEPFQEEIQRYGALYTLKNRTKMGEQMFYTFGCSGRENLLIVPRFAEQYRQVERIYTRFNPSKKVETSINHIRKEICRRPVVEEFPNEDSDTGVMTVITANYNAIKVQFEYMHSRLTLSSEFEIMNNNLFGNGVVVIMNMDMEGATLG